MLPTDENADESTAYTSVLHTSKNHVQNICVGVDAQRNFLDQIDVAMPVSIPSGQAGSNLPHASSCVCAQPGGVADTSSLCSQSLTTNQYLDTLNTHAIEMQRELCASRVSLSAALRRIVSMHVL